MKTVHNRERAQSLVIVAIMLVVLIGMVALIIDGGMAYSQRRTAQNAADAAALAGAQEMCSGRPYSQVVQDYALNRNHATWANPTPGDKELTVVAGIDYDSFLAGILGHPTMSVQASATAGCFSPCEGNGFIPVAWSCKKNITDTVPMDPSTCITRTGTINSPGPLYILMDNQSISNDCISNGGTINCDLDTSNPGDEVFTGGNRGWLNLDRMNVNCGPSTLDDWINGVNVPPDLRIHTWLMKCPGEMTPTFVDIAKLMPQNKNIVTIPVYDSNCDGNASNPANGCLSRTHAEDLYPSKYNGNDLNYHIISFSSVRITCYQKGNGQGQNKLINDPIISLHVDDKNQEDCLGRWKFFDLNKNNPEFSKKYNLSSLETIEGYFVSDYDPDLKGACEPTGVGPVTVYLK